MLYSLPQNRDAAIPARMVAVAAFTALTAFGARVTIETGGPVPFTLQVLPSLLAGLVLGWRDGALSQVLYVALIGMGIPLDARALGTAALVGPTAGFLIGFIPSAAVAGAIAQISGSSLWMRWLAGAYALFILYVFGIFWLGINLNIPFNVAFNTVDGFMGFDIAKALMAAGLAETGRVLLTNRADA